MLREFGGKGERRENKIPYYLTVAWHQRTRGIGLIIIDNVEGVLHSA
jgi:hypothetical protein